MNNDLGGIEISHLPDFVDPPDLLILDVKLHVQD